HSMLKAEDYARQTLAQFGPDKSGWAPLVLADALVGNEKSFDEHGSAMEISGKRGERAEAWRIVHDYAQKHPYWPEAWLRLLVLENSQSNREEILQKALSFCGGDLDLRSMRANRLMQTGHEKEAAEYFAEGLDVRPFHATNALDAAAQFRRAGDYVRS